MKKRIVLYGLLAIVLGVAIFKRDISRVVAPVLQLMRGEATVSDRVKQYGAAVQTRLQTAFQKQGIAYPPKLIVFVGLKQERRLEMYASDSTNQFRHIRDYPILAASGNLGPKLREGDGQVPEGIYCIESLNPNSLFHLSLRLNYPNEFDRARAHEEKRTNLGGDIMIHGNQVSVGCLAMGDEAAEDLFVLAALAGIENVRVILSPVDFRNPEMNASTSGLPAFTSGLYAQLRKEMLGLPTQLKR